MPSPQTRPTRGEPQHLVVIGDGNRRWAKQRGLEPGEGHLAAVYALVRLVDRWAQSSIGHLTFWWSSADNLRLRSRSELGYLFEAKRRFFDQETGRWPEIRIAAYGDWQVLIPPPLASLVARVTDERRSRQGERCLTFLLGYNGNEEMVRAIERIRRSDDQRPVTNEMVRASLDTAALPDVDMIVRTGGDPHLSAGLLMWQVQYTQLHFTETLWPDFVASDFDEAMRAYREARRLRGA
jgi:undecaprenyl diphosphate synthase